MKKTNEKGFTLIELLVVIAIIGLLSTLAVVSLNSARQKARDARRQSDLKQISTAMELHMSEVETYPIHDVGDCTTDNSIAQVDAASLDQTICSGNSIVANGETLLASIPEDPTNSATYFYGYETDTTGAETGESSYCIWANLEGQTGSFVCTNGSCFIDDDDVGCAEDGTVTP